MDELLQRLYASGARYLLIGGQAMRLLGMPRFSMDWDFFIPPRDKANFHRLNQLLEEELDVPLSASSNFGTPGRVWYVCTKFSRRVPRGIDLNETAELPSGNRVCYAKYGNRHACQMPERASPARRKTGRSAATRPG